MKILYGVQGTGNGHISRANAMASALAKYPEVDVTWLFSGREKSQLFGVADNFLWRRGMTFISADGEVSYLKTLFANNPVSFVRDVRRLRLDNYDQVIVDFEPVVAWAAKRAHRPALGIGHQYAFNYPIPLAGNNFVSHAVLRNFAPARTSLGLHWHHFNYPILPPIVDLEANRNVEKIANKVVVYLAFENQQKVIQLLRNIESHEFYVYAPGLEHQDTCNIHTRPPSRAGFKQDLVSAAAVICNTGFELISECLALGTRVLTRPLDNQMEQFSNARALEELEYATIMYELDRRAIEHWLTGSESVKINYPAVHEHIAAWLVGGRHTSIESLVAATWDGVNVVRTSGSQTCANYH